MPAPAQQQRQQQQRENRLNHYQTRASKHAARKTGASPAEMVAALRANVGTATLADLCASEKAKVAKLVEELMRVAAERQLLDSELEAQQKSHDASYRALQDDLTRERGESQMLQGKVTQALHLLRSYQKKLSALLRERKEASKEKTGEGQLGSSQIEASRLALVMEEQRQALEGALRKIENLQELQLSYSQLAQANTQEREAAALLAKELQQKLSIEEEAHKVEMWKCAQLEATCARLQAECTQLNTALSVATQSAIGNAVTGGAERVIPHEVSRRDEPPGPHRATCPNESKIFFQAARLREHLDLTVNDPRLAAKTTVPAHDQCRAQRPVVSPPHESSSEHVLDSDRHPSEKIISSHFPRGSSVFNVKPNCRLTGAPQNVSMLGPVDDTKLGPQSRSQIHRTRASSSHGIASNKGTLSSLLECETERFGSKHNYRQETSHLLIDESISEAATVLSDLGYYEDSLFQLVELLDMPSDLECSATDRFPTRNYENTTENVAHWKYSILSRSSNP